MAQLIEHKSNYPQAIGAIDGTHIAITPPADGYQDFICRKQYPSVVLQAVTDGEFIFRDIYCNTPGSAHDAAVFHRSPLSNSIERNMPINNRQINDISIPLHILGDPAYPLSKHIMKGYVGRNLTPIQESFNVYHSSARMCVEIAFGRLKSRWRILKKRMDVDFKFSPEVITTCCILHNICERGRVAIPQELHVPGEDAFPQPEQQVAREANGEAKVMQRALTEYMGRFPLRRSFHL